MEIDTESMNSTNLFREKDVFIICDNEPQCKEIENLEVFINGNDKGTQMYPVKYNLQLAKLNYKRKMFLYMEDSGIDYLYGFDENTGEPIHGPFFKKSKSDLETNTNEPVSKEQSLTDTTNEVNENNISSEIDEVENVPEINSISKTIIIENNETETENEIDDSIQEQKPTENNEISSNIAPIAQSTPSASNKSKQIREQLFKLPFEYGWKRELVYRAIPDATKENKGEVYYISPSGKKCRTKSEIAQFLTPELTVDNFAFSKEPIGMSPDLEIIRNAKLKEKSVTDVVTGKRISKPKAPKGASPPPQGWTPSKALKNSTFQSRSSLNNTKTIPDVEKSKPNVKGSNKSIKKNEPCTVQCTQAIGLVPQLQCAKCLCLYHHDCVGLNRYSTEFQILSPDSKWIAENSTNAKVYICESCNPANQILQKDLSQTTSVASTTKTLTNETQMMSPNLNETSSPVNRTIKATKVRPNSSTNTPALYNSTRNDLNIEKTAHLPQSIAVIKGRKYVVIRKPMSCKLPSLNNDDFDLKDSLNPSSDIQSITNSELSLANKKRSVIGSGSKSKPVNVSGGGESTCASVTVDSFANNFFGNVSLGYDILRHAFQYLKVQELLRAACVCRLWNVVANNPLLWRTVRMKNSQVNDWAGLAAALRRYESKNLDLKKMLISSIDTDAMWEEFSNHIKTVVSLESIDFCRCSAKVVENLFLTNTNLKVINALSIKDDAINLSNISGMTNLQELRLKTTELCILEGDLSPLKTLKNLTHLSLTSIKYLGCRQTDFLGELQNLESLELGECTDFELNFATNVLKKLNKLQRLRMENGQVNSAMLEIVSAVSTIETLIQLEIVNFDIKPGFDTNLAKCKNIKKLLLIPTYISQSAATNHIVLSAVLQLAPTLEVFTWAVTLELLRVTSLYVGQCDDSKKKDKRQFDECIPVLKPVPGSLSIEIEQTSSAPSKAPQIEILPLGRVENILTVGLKRTKFKIIKIPYHATWKQNLVE